MQTVVRKAIEIWLREVRTSVGPGGPRLVLVAAILVAQLGCTDNPALKSMGASIPSQIQVPLQALIVGDDDGGRRARVDPADLVASVDFANQTFASAGIRFEFSPGEDLATIESTILNDLSAPPIPNWPLAKSVGDRVAAGYPGKVVVLLRHGPGNSPAGNGFAGIDHAFIVMPGNQNAFHCGHPHTGSLAHEIGHFLGLDHTFAGDPFPNLEAAEAHFLAHGRDPSVFNGDGLADTPPDPAIREFECQRAESISLGGVTLPLPRRNIMSYYDEGDSLSLQQTRRARWVLEQRLAWPATMRPVNATGPGTREAEAMEIVSFRDASSSVQSMDGYGAGDWSGGAQLFVGRGVESEVTLRFRLDTHAEQVVLYATRAPDFAMVRVLVDDQPVGRTIDLYAPMVLPSGAIPLGPIALQPGEHRMTIRAVGKNPASTGCSFGIDALAWHRG